jgi:hypothetical protein
MASATSTSGEQVKASVLHGAKDLRVVSNPGNILN